MRALRGVTRGALDSAANQWAQSATAAANVAARVIAVLSDGVGDLQVGCGVRVWDQVLVEFLCLKSMGAAACHPPQAQASHAMAGEYWRKF